MNTDVKRHIINADALPRNFPTHRHEPLFWEWLGRTVATFGLLEETLGKAIFSFTATRQFRGENLEAAFEKWLPNLERALTDQLGGLINAYAKAVKENGDATISNLDDLTESLQKAAAVRNVLCHGSWRFPDSEGRSLPLYVNRKMEVFQDFIDVAYLEQVQKHVAELICAVINSVTHMGWQFPGSRGPGVTILNR